MNIEKLKQNWQQSGSKPTSQAELKQMMALNQHAVIKRTKIRFVIEIFWLTLFLLVFYNAFDGDTKPVWANIVLFSTTLAYITNRLISWYVLNNPIKANNIISSLQKFQQQLKLIAKTTTLTALLFGASIILFFSTGIDFTTVKYIMLTGMGITLLVLIYISHRIWQKRIGLFESTVNEFAADKF